MFLAHAPGKLILCGEHAVVYGHPALAVPVTQVQALATVRPGGDEIVIDAQDLGHTYPLAVAVFDDVLAQAVRLTLGRLARPLPPFTLTLTSTIPPASGLGSGAAVCTAAVRAIAAYAGVELSPADVSALVFETEKMLHGTPSGIDNTVIAYGQPVWFVRGQPPTPFRAAQPLRLLIGDTGVHSPTKIAVGDLRAAWQREPARYEAWFGEIGKLVQEVRELLERPGTEGNRGNAGNDLAPRVGALLNRNQTLLQTLGVSSPELETLIDAARQAGAAGAKLSGGGRGGNMLALVTDATAENVREALLVAGAKRVVETKVGGETGD